jgi:hypothetical protein
MANYNEQVLRLWNEWEESTGAESGDPNDFIEWAVAEKKLALRPQDLNKLMRRQVTSALRQALRVDENGTIYRAKQCVMLFEGGFSMRRWFDTDTGGTPNLRQRAVRQRRDGIANDVYRAMSDVEHMNWQFSKDPQLSFVLDFKDDYEERKAAASLDLDGDIEGEAA